MSLINSFDRNLTTYIQGLPSAVHPLMTGASLLGEPATVVAIALFSSLVAWRQAQNKVALVFLAAIAACGANGVLKMFLHRTRPDTLYVTNMRFKSYSFPSGHAFGSLLVYGLLAYLAFKHFSYPLNYLFTVAAGLLIFLIGVSRVYLGAHFPTDVIGGWLLSAVCLLGLIRLVLLK